MYCGPIRLVCVSPRHSVETDADKGHDIGVLEFAHYDRLRYEVLLGVWCRQLWQGFDGDRELGKYVAHETSQYTFVYLAERSLAQSPT